MPIPSTPGERFKIEKNVPLASPTRTRYPWAKLIEVGDSFFVPAATPEAVAGIYNAKTGYCQRHGVKISGRKVEGGYRFWLVYGPRHVAPAQPIIEKCK